MCVCVCVRVNVKFVDFWKYINTYKGNSRCRFGLKLFKKDFFIPLSPLSSLPNLSIIPSKFCYSIFEFIIIKFISLNGPKMFHVGFHNKNQIHFTSRMLG